MAPSLSPHRTVTKAQIVDQIAEATGLTKLETEAVVDGFMHTVIQAVVEGEGVELRGVGSFRAQARAARTARNPRTNEPVHVAARTLPVFRPAAEFKRLVEEANA